MADGDSKGRIALGECLDQLLNRECRFPFERFSDGAVQGKFGGLVCPSADQSRRGTGNIVIKGAAGTGKSTLALQIAVEAARRNKHVNTAYISLEESPQQLFSKAEMFGWEGWLTPLTERPEILKGEAPSREKLPDDLAAILQRSSFACPYGYAVTRDGQHRGCDQKRQEDGCRYSCFPCGTQRRCSSIPRGKTPRKEAECGGSCGLHFNNHVLLPSLDARVFEPSDEYEKHDSLFKVRLAQLEDLLQAAKELNTAAIREEKKRVTDSKGKRYGGKRLDIVCIDSLNVLGQGHLTRDHISALFELFRNYGIIGVFVYEQLETGHVTGRSDHSLKDVEFLADTVIDLTGSEFQGYWVRHFHISKSRHQHQVLGRHPFKILEFPREKRDEEGDDVARRCRHLVTSQSPGSEPEHKEIRMSRFGVRVFPSIHTVIRSSRRDKEIGRKRDTKVFFQEKNLNDIAGDALRRSYPVLGTVSGPLVAGKSILAFNFLLQGLVEGQNGILVTLGESCVFDTGNAMVGKASANARRYKKQRGRTHEAIVRSLNDVGSQDGGGGEALAECLLTRAGFAAAEPREPNRMEGGKEKEARERAERLCSDLDLDRRPNLTEAGLCSAVKSLQHRPENVVPRHPGDSASRSSDSGDLAKQLAESVRELIEARDAAVKEDLLRNSTFIDLLDKGPDGNAPLETNLCRLLGYLMEHHKVKYAVWSCRGRKRDEDKAGEPGPRALDNYIIEMALQPGTLLPEEVATFVRLIYAALTLSTQGGGRNANRDNWPRRAVLQNASRIGISYPFLDKPTTGPELFLTGLSHLFHCRDTDFLITVPTGGVPASVEIAKQAVFLADSVLECSHLDVFGDRYVTVTGPGMIERDVHQAGTHEDVPGVLLRRRDGTFSIDMQALGGLVGFSTGDIRRPGVLLQLFEEGGLHSRYNHQVKRLVQFAMGESTASDGSLLRENPRVQVDTFDSEEAGAFHRSLDLLEGSPLSNTVVRTVDEFAIRAHSQAGGDEREDKDRNHGSVYYRNVMLLLFDKGTFENDGVQSLDCLQGKLQAVRLRLQLSVGLRATWRLASPMAEPSGAAGLTNARHELLKQLTAMASLEGLAESQGVPHEHHRAASEGVSNALESLCRAVNCVIKTANTGAKKGDLSAAESLVGILASLGDTTDESGTRRQVGRRLACQSVASFGSLLQEAGNGGGDGDCRRLVKKVGEKLTSSVDAWRREYTERALAFWQRLSDLVDSGTVFLYDTRARETLASLAMDSVLCLSGRPQGWCDLSDKESNEKVVALLKGKEDTGPLRRILGYFGRVLPKAEPLLQSVDSAHESCSRKQQDERKSGLSDVAKQVFQKNRKFILLAWYSHVRELLELLDKDGLGVPTRRDMTRRTSIGNLKVLSLPSGGFKGDWYLQVPVGSVSESLGRDVCKQLLAPAEDFNRFVAGVGLPCWPRKESEYDRSRWMDWARFEDLKQYSKVGQNRSLKAWPGSEIPLQILLSFHRFAHRRSDIVGYESIHNELFAIMEDIRLSGKRRGGEGLSTESHAELIIKILERLKREG